MNLISNFGNSILRDSFEIEDQEDSSEAIVFMESTIEKRSIILFFLKHRECALEEWEANPVSTMVFIVIESERYN